MREKERERDWGSQRDLCASRLFFGMLMCKVSYRKRTMVIRAVNTYYTGLPCARNGAINMSILQMEEPSHREVKKFGRSHS